MGTRTVKRSLVILFVCGIVVFGVVWRITPEFAQGLLELRSYAASIPFVEPAPAKKEPEPVKSAAKKPAKAARPTRPVAAPVTEAPVYATFIATTPIVEKRQPAPPSLKPSEFKVAIENAELLSSNSPTGSVVRRLNRGDIVELQFRVNNAGPEWMFVNVANPRGSGFVRSEVVTKQETVEQASR